MKVLELHKVWERHPHWPKQIPWSFVEPHNAQAIINHGQSLEKLASRGGLDLTEIAAVVEDRPWRHMSDAEIDAFVATIPKVNE